MRGGELEYVGFWPRVGASLVDSLIAAVLCVPLLTAIYGPSYWDNGAVAKGPADIVVSWVFPAAAIIVLWIYRQATPGKMAFSARIVDAATGDKPNPGQMVGRYLGYFVSTLPLGLGLLWVAFDGRKQGWHDKLAGTVVVRPRTRTRSTRPAAFAKQRGVGPAVKL